MMVRKKRLDGDRGRRSVRVDFGRYQWALQEPGQVEHRGVEGGKGGRRRRGIDETHGPNETLVGPSSSFFLAPRVESPPFLIPLLLVRTQR